MEIFAALILIAVMLVRLARGWWERRLVVETTTVPELSHVRTRSSPDVAPRPVPRHEDRANRVYRATAKKLIDDYCDRHGDRIVAVLCEYRDAKQTGSVFCARPQPDRSFWWLGPAHPADVSKTLAIVAVSVGITDERTGAARLYPATISINPTIVEAEKLTMKLADAAGDAFPPARHGPGYTRVDMPGFPASDTETVRIR